MPPFKKNNPGCNCCRRILVWDLGFPIEDSPGEYAFGNYERLESIYEEIDIALDYVTGESRTPFDFYSLNPDFNPYTTAVDDGNWTGNIRDYTLIIWNQALGGAGTGLVGQCITIDTIRHGLWGGAPDWWDTIIDGLWEGRLFMSTGGNSTVPEEALDTHSVNVFLNSLTDVTGMTIDSGAIYGGELPDPPTLSADAAGGVDLMEGVSVIRPIPFSTQISGGTTILTNGETWNTLREIPAWCDPDTSLGSNSAWPIAQRNRVALPLVGGGVPTATVDFVISQTRVAFRSLDGPHTLWDRFTDPQKAGFIEYMHNLYEVEIAES